MSPTLRIIAEDDVITDSQLPEESMIRNLAEMEDQMALNGAPRQYEEKKFTQPPQFLRPLLPQVSLKENERAKFETFVQPANDPSLTVDWYKDGKPITNGKIGNCFDARTLVFILELSMQNQDPESKI